MNILGNALAKGKRKTLREALEDRGGFECTRCGHKGHYGKCDKCECDRQVRKSLGEIVGIEKAAPDTETFKCRNCGEDVPRTVTHGDVFRGVANCNGKRGADPFRGARAYGKHEDENGNQQNRVIGKAADTETEPHRLGAVTGGKCDGPGDYLGNGEYEGDHDGCKRPAQHIIADSVKLHPHHGAGIPIVFGLCDPCHESWKDAAGISKGAEMIDDPEDYVEIRKDGNRCLHPIAGARHMDEARCVLSHGHEGDHAGAPPQPAKHVYYPPDPVAGEKLDCGHAPTPQDYGAVKFPGYGKDADGKTLCYNCAGDRDREHLTSHSDWTGYIERNHHGGHDVTNFPGSLRLPAQHHHRHSDGKGDTYHFKGPDGALWRATQRGDNTIARCRRAK